VLDLISITGVKHLPALFAKTFQWRPHFLHRFGRAPSDLPLTVLYTIEISRTVCEILASIQWPWNPG